MNQTTVQPETLSAGSAKAAPAVAAEEQSTEPHGLVLEVDFSKYLPEPLQPAWQAMQDHPFLLAFALVILGYCVGRLLRAVIHKVFGRFAALTRSNVDDHIVHFLEAPVMQTAVTLSLVAATLVLGLPESYEQVTIKVLFSILVLFWGKAWFAATPVVLAELEANPERFKMLQPRTVPLFEMGIKLLLLGLFVYFIFAIWGVDATAWLASAGIIGIAVGFAAKDTLANLISGVSIVADAPYKIGDYIVLDTGERGIVTSLGIRSTRLLTRDDVEISIPNAVIGAAKITNESGGPWVKQRIRVPVGVAYGSDTDKVVSILEEIALNNPGIVDQPAPRVRMRSFGDHALNFELLGWIATPEQRGLVVHQLLLEIYKRFRADGIEIPVPQHDVRLRQTDTEQKQGDRD